MSKKIFGATETSIGVFHADDWGQSLDENVLKLLKISAQENKNNKSRYCLHPNPEEILQVTYLSFIRPYSDRIHKHPFRPEVMIPIYGRATFSTFDETGNLKSSKVLDGAKPFAVSTNLDCWHSLEILTESFLVVEIGKGPFNKDSTVYL
jgi:cupin fold WbuC family metalloprotein